MQEVLLKSIQGRIYKDIYAFSDNEDKMDDIDKRYKYLNTGFKNFTRQKRKYNVGADQTEAI